MKILSIFGNISKDIIVPVACSAAIAVSSTLLYVDVTSKVEHTGAEQIGTITFKKKIAERKYAGIVIWEDLAQNSPVYNYDSIRTAEDSLSVIKFKDKSEIEIGESTLILLEWSERGGAKIDFSRGAISARTAETGKKLKIVSEGTEVSLEKGDVQISKGADKNIELNVAAGAAVVETAQGESTVTENKKAVISGEKTEVKEKTLVLQSPVPDAAFITLSGLKEVTFKWKSKKESDKVYLEISKNNEFSEIVLGEYLSDNKKKHSLPEGLFYWRISRRGEEKEVSESRKIHIIKDEPVLPITPALREIFTCFKENPLVSFSWSPGKAASSYEVVVADDPKLKNIIHTFKTEATTVATDKLGIGKYFWTVRSVYSFGEAGSLDNRFINSFKIEKEKEVPPPKIISPENKAAVSAMKLANTGIIFNWTAHDEIRTYEVEFSKDTKLQDIILKSEANTNFYRLSETLDPGKYFFRVTGIVSEERKTKPSRALLFEIKSVKEIIALSPADGANIDLSSDEKLSFEWDDPNFGNSYLFELAEDRKFSKILYKKEADKQNYTLGETLKGNFYWRVSLLDKNKKVLAASNVSHAVIAVLLKDPEAIGPKNHYSIDMTYKDRLSFSWKRVRGATHYSVRIFQFTSRYNKQIFEIETDKTGFNFTRMEYLDKGNFYWEVQALMYRGKEIIKKSRAKRFYFSIRLQEPTEVPEIITSDTLFIE